MSNHTIEVGRAIEALTKVMSPICATYEVGKTKKMLAARISQTGRLYYEVTVEDHVVMSTSNLSDAIDSYNVDYDEIKRKSV